MFNNNHTKNKKIHLKKTILTTVNIFSFILDLEKNSEIPAKALVGITQNELIINESVFLFFITNE